MNKRAMAPDGEQVESPGGSARTSAALAVEHALLFHEVRLRCDAVTETPAGMVQPATT